HAEQAALRPGRGHRVREAVLLVRDVRLRGDGGGAVGEGEEGFAHEVDLRGRCGQQVADTIVVEMEHSSTVACRPGCMTRRRDLTCTEKARSRAGRTRPTMDAMNTWGNEGHGPGGDPSWLGGKDRGAGQPRSGDGTSGDAAWNGSGG